MSTQTIAVEGAIAELFDAINAFDADAIIDAFTDDALVNDTKREFWGKNEIRRWVDREVVGGMTTVEVVDAVQHDGLTIAQCIHGNLGTLEPSILTYHFTVVAGTGRIANLIIVNNHSER